MRNELKRAVQKFAGVLESEGATVDTSNVDYDRLLDAVQHEYGYGAAGSVYDVIVDFHDSIGLEEFGFYYNSY